MYQHQHMQMLEHSRPRAILAALAVAAACLLGIAALGTALTGCMFAAGAAAGGAAGYVAGHEAGEDEVREGRDEPDDD